MTKPTSLNKSAPREGRAVAPIAGTTQGKAGPRISTMILVLVIVASLVGCGLMLFAPTMSLATNPVYKGF